MGRGGDAVVETEEGIVLVPGALPGEHIELELAASRRGAARGRLKQILRRAEARIEPPCPDAARCGGCPLMCAEPDLQRRIKLGFLEEACRGVPGADEARTAWVHSAHDLGYRRRARLAWHGGTLGYRRLHSKRVADIADCMVLVSPLRRAWTHVREELAEPLRGSGEIRLELTGDRGVVVGLSTEDDQTPALFDACRKLTERAPIVGVTLRTTPATAEATWGQTDVRWQAGQLGLHAPPRAFTQANDDVNAALVEAVGELAEPEGLRVLELHSGVGNFTIELASRAPSSLVAVERDPSSVEACRANLKQRGLKARVTCGDANQPPKGRYDVIVLDPPRQGARALFERGDDLRGAKRIIYVSCDTATLARDLGLATRHGYRIDHVIGFDMFPQTAHLESLVRLVRA